MALINDAMFNFFPRDCITMALICFPEQVFAGVFPLDQSEYNDLRSALDKLTLNDPSVDIRQDSRYE